MRLPPGTILDCVFVFTRNGDFYQPSPEPTLKWGLYPNDTDLTPLPTISATSTGRYKVPGGVGVFTALQSTAEGIYTALAATTDPLADRSGECIIQWEVSSTDTDILELLAAIQAQTALITEDNMTIVSVVDLDGELHIFPYRAYTVAAGNPIDLPVPGLVAGLTPKLAIQRIDDTILTITGTRVSDGNGRFQMTMVESGTLFGSAPKRQAFEIITVDGSGNQVQKVEGIVNIHKVLIQ